MSNADVITRLEAWLKTNHPEAYRGLAPGLSDPQIDEYESTLGVKFPPLMRALYRWRNGNSEDSFAAIQNNMSLMPLEEVAGTRSFMRTFSEDGTFEHPDYWHKAWVPFLHNGAGSHLCLDPAGSFGGKPGQILEFWKGDSDRNIVAPSFEAWLTTFVDSLDAGLWQYEANGGNIDEKDGLDAFLAERLPGYPIEVSIDGDDDDDEDDDDEDDDDEDDDDDDDDDDDKD